MFFISYKQNSQNQQHHHISVAKPIKEATHIMTAAYNSNVYNQKEIKPTDGIATKTTKKVINSFNLVPTKGLTGNARAEAELHNLSVITTNPFAIPAYIFSNPFRK